MTEIHIIGAGMAGLLAANMLRRHKVTVFEKQKSLPNNHSAVLRFRTPEVGNVLGIEFKKVQMVKTVVPYKNLVADALSYSYKCTGKYRTDRSILDGTVISDRYIAPYDLIDKMAKSIDIQYGENYLNNRKSFDPFIPIISTIPMPILIGELFYRELKQSDFDYLSGYNLVGKVQNTEAYTSILFPDPDKFYSRISITGDQYIAEFPKLIANVPVNDSETNIDDIKKTISIELGIDNWYLIDKPTWFPQQYSKILPIDEHKRKNFIRWATNEYNIYSLGRYATWRPKLLLDDLINDVRKIERWIENPNSYRI